VHFDLRKKKRKIPRGVVILIINAGGGIVWLEYTNFHDTLR
jgi:hypothetical protein